jgi:hypothetical protein
VDHLALQRCVREALRDGESERAQALLASDPSQLAATTPFGSWMPVAAYFGRLEVVRYLVESGGDVNGRGGLLGGTPLNEAALKGHSAVVEYLLSVGAEMETREPAEGGSRGQGALAELGSLPLGRRPGVQFVLLRCPSEEVAPWASS